jgi:PHP family Zn ribbon phosphoesterase
VDQRVEKLADRESGYRPLDPIDFIYLLPLSEIIAHALRIENLGHAKIWQIYNALIEKFGNEYSVLLNAKKREISQIADTKIAETIIGIRNNNVKVIPGYDGVYGKIEFPITNDFKVTNSKSEKKISYLDEFL